MSNEREQTVVLLGRHQGYQAREALKKAFPDRVGEVLWDTTAQSPALVAGNRTLWEAMGAQAVLPAQALAVLRAAELPAWPRTAAHTNHNLKFSTWFWDVQNLLKATLKSAPEAFVAAWRRLEPSPFKTLVGLSLSLLGNLPAGELPEGTREVFATGYVLEQASPNHHFCVVPWGKQAWAQAVVDAALALNLQEYYLSPHGMIHALSAATADQAVHLATRSHRYFVTECIAHLRAREGEVLPVLAARVRDFSPSKVDHKAAICTVALACLGPAGSFPEDLDPLLLEILKRATAPTPKGNLSSYTYEYSKTTEHLRDALAALPVPRREAMLLQIENPWYLAAACPTPGGARHLIQCLASRSGGFKEAAAKDVRESLVAVMDGGLSGALEVLGGKTFRRRAWVVHGVASQADPQATDILIKLLSADAETRAEAAAGLAALGQSALSKVGAAFVKTKRKPVRIELARLLDSDPGSAEGAALAAELLPKAKEAEVIALLKSASAKGAQAPVDGPSDEELAMLRRTVRASADTLDKGWKKLPKNAAVVRVTAEFLTELLRDPTLKFLPGGVDTLWWNLVKGAAADPETPRMALKVLGHVPAGREYLADRMLSAFTNAYNLYRDRPSPEVLDAISTFLQTGSPTTKTRKELYSSLSYSAGQSGAELFHLGVQDKSAKVQEVCVAALVKLDCVDEARVAGFLSDKRTYVRRGGAMVLAAKSVPKARAAVEGALAKEKSNPVIHQLQLALAACSPPAEQGETWQELDARLAAAKKPALPVPVNGATLAMLRWAGSCAPTVATMLGSVHGVNEPSAR